MKDLSTTVNGIEFENPFLLGSGPPGTNARVIAKAFRAGWGGVVAKTTSLSDTEVINVVPRYGKLKSASGDVIGFQNIELISDRPFEDWEADFAALRKEFPTKVVIASIMECYDKSRWQELASRCEKAGAKGLELNFSCPHGHPERGMGAAMGQDPAQVEEVTSWVKEVVTIPIWAKMTPNITDITIPSASAIRGGASGVSAINTILSVIGIALKSLRPFPTVEGHSVPGGYSALGAKPVGLRMVQEIASVLKDFPISGMGGVMTSRDAIEFLLVGSSTVQVCTGAMLQGLGMIDELKEGLSSFMEQHDFKQVQDIVGKSLPYFTTHHHLVELQAESKALKMASRASTDKAWGEESLQNQTSKMTSND